MKKTVLTFSNGKIQAITFAKQKGDWVESETIEDEYEPGKVANFLTKIQKEKKIRSWRVLLPEEKTHLDLISFAADANLDRERVFEKAREETKAKLDETFFDWKWIETTRDRVWVQYLGVEEDFIRPLSKAVAGINSKISLMMPESFALALLAKKENGPVLLETAQLLVAVSQTNVFARAKKKDKDSHQKESFKKDIEERWGIELREKKPDLPPVFGLLADSVPNKSGRGLIILNLLTGFSRDREKENKPTVKSSKQKKVIPLILMTVIFGAALIGGGLWIKNSDQADESEPEPVLVPTGASIAGEPVETPAPQAETLSKSISIQVLNGNGRAGVAGAGRDFLSAKGFENIEIGNAGKYDYETTRVSYKSSLAGVIDQFVNILEEEYVVELDEELNETEEFDVIVIVGLT